MLCVLQLQKSERAQKEAVDRAISATNHWMGRFTVVVIGPGLGRDELVHKTVIEVRYLGHLEHSAHSNSSALRHHDLWQSVGMMFRLYIMGLGYKL